MVSKASLSALTVSRRTTLQMALAAALSGSIVGIPRFAAAQAEATGTWNWRGNAGHTGELPGPGLDLDGALGELWRIPRDEFSSGGSFALGGIVGYLNGVVYTRNGDSLWARRLEDGEFLWAQSPAKLAAPATPEASPEASPVAGAGEVAFIQLIAIDGDLVLATLNNGHLWALDATTGDLRWDFDSEAASIDVPTVVDHVAYSSTSDGVIAIELGAQPVVRWRVGVQGWLLGAEAGFVYLAVYDTHFRVTEIRALAAADGSEYWRASLESLGQIGNVYGISHDGMVLGVHDSENSRRNLVMVDQKGQISWSRSRDYDLSYFTWILGDTVTTLNPTNNDYGTHWMVSQFAENGNANWDLEINASRWTQAYGGEPVLCAGRAYALVRDADQGERLLVVIDPVNAEVFAVRDSLAIPLFVADGVMLAQDYDTGEIVAIGPVPAVLQVGGRAAVTQDATLRGAPSETAIERAQVAAGTVVDVTGESETANGTEWVPVYDSDSDERGWLPVDVLAGQDGSIRFSEIGTHWFGQFKSYPKFSSGTRAEITEQVTLRGAPSETSAEKATLEAGTLVTVTSVPTETDDGEWCSIRVDDTGDSGWVPLSVLTLASTD